MRFRHQGFSLIEVIVAIFIGVVALATVATIYTSANQQQKVTTLVNQITQVKQAIHAIYQSQPDFTGLSYNALLQANKIPPAWTSSSNTQGVTPFGSIGVGSQPYPGDAATAHDMAAISIAVNNLNVCVAIVQALAPDSAQLIEYNTGTVIVPVQTASSGPRNLSVVQSQATAACKSAITTSGSAALLYEFI